MLVEALGLSILGVHKEHSDADAICHLDCLEHKVLEERRPKTLSSMLGVDCHATEQDRRHLVWLITAEALRR